MIKKSKPELFEVCTSSQEWSVPAQEVPSSPILTRFYELFNLGEKDLILGE